MASIFLDLCAFFGITAEAPQNLGELLPWLLQIVVALSLVLFCFGMVREIVKTICRGRF